MKVIAGGTAGMPSQANNVAGFYLLAMAALGLHLYHGTWAAFRTLGVARPSTQPLKRRIALILAIVIAGGFMAIPLAAMAGLFPEVDVVSAPTGSPVEMH